MIIQSSHIDMHSARSYSQSSTAIGRVAASAATIRAGLANNSLYHPITDETILPDSTGNTGKSSLDTEKEKDGSGLTFSDRLEDSATEQMTKSLLGLRTGTGNTIAEQNYRKAMEDIRRRCIAFLMKIFYGQDRDAYREKLDSLSTQETAQESFSQGSSTTIGEKLQVVQPREVTFRVFAVNQTIETTYTEEEQTGFTAAGKVINKNGQVFDINVELSMTRRFMEQTSHTTTLEEWSMVDPLVINLDTNIAGLSDQKFQFDIDSDGILDTISQLNAGSGYLALDQNDDGIINDGSELFGTKSGDGFADLAQYDSDGNGWIDEADEIWDKLLIWTKDESGRDKLYHLTEKGVGAICLQNAATDFSLKSLKDNSVNGAIRSTGIFLYENGGVGTLQHLDVVNETLA